MDPREQAAAFDFRELWRADASAKGPRPLSEYLARFPGHDAAIVREWQQLTAPVPATPDTAAVDGKHEELPSLGPYRLVDVLGQGGQGTVYLAEDTRLQNRIVALKVLDAVALGLSSARRQRLRREAEALARLDHPGVCGIYEAQLEGPRPYLAMRYVQGPTLQEALAQNIAAPSTTEDLHRVLHCIERTALAAHAAHESGIVHRDIKPANIILDRDGRPVLLDFGLARDEDPESLALTLSGDVFGTLAYMAPEQVTGGRDLDRRVDVYALGVTLYECLTLAQPFSAPTRDAVMGNIKAGRSRDVRALNPAVSRDLAVVGAKAMEVARERRYATARALAEDLANVRELRPIDARPKSLALRARRWTQRHPVATVMLCVLTLALVTGSVLSLQMRQQARALLAWKRAHSSILLAEADPGHALDQAYEVATEQSDHELRSVLHSVLWTNWQTYEIPAVNPLNAASSKTTPPVLLADGATIAFATGLGELVLMGLADGRLRGAFAGAHSTQATAAALSRDGETLLTADFGGVVSLWDTRALLEGSLLGKSWSEDPRFVTCAAAAAGADVFFVGGVEGRLERFALGSDGTYDATATPIPGCDDLTVQDLWPQPGGRILLAHVQRGVGNSQTERSLCLFDSVRGDVLLRVTFPASLGLRAEWSPRGDRFAFCEQEGALGLFDAEGHSLWQVDEQSTLNSVRFAPGGTQLLSFGFRGLTVWDADTGGEGKRQSSATGRSFEDGWLSPDGALLAVAIRDSTIRLFETGEWNEIAYLSHSVTGYGVHGLWGRDGRLAVFDHTSIQGFAPPFRPYLPRLGEGQGARVVSLAFDPDGELLASATEDNSVRIWDLGSGRVRREVPCLQAPLRVRASSEQLLVVTKEPVARLWPWSPAGEPIELRGHEAPVTDGWFLAEGEEVLTIAADSCARLWSAGDGRPLREFPMEAGPLHTAAFDEAADLLAVGGEEPAVHVFELSTGRHLRRLTGPAEGPLVFVGRPTYLHFDAVNHRLYAAAQGSGGVACWDIAHDFAYSMLGGMSAGSTGWALTDTEGRWLVCSESVLGFTRWFDAATHAKLAWDPAWEPGTMINRMQFSGDGRRLLLASYDGTVRLFDMARLEPWSILRSDHGGAMDACFSPDGERVAVGYKDGALLVWPFDPLPVAREHLVRRVER